MAELSPNSLFTNNMVIQRNQPIPVWGRAKAGAKVKAVHAASLAALGRFDESSSRIEEALSLDPQSPEASVEKARLEMSLGQLAQSRETLKGLLNANAEYAPGWSLLGDLERRDRELEKAEAAAAG